MIKVPKKGSKEWVVVSELYQGQIENLRKELKKAKNKAEVAEILKQVESHAARLEGLEFAVQHIGPKVAEAWSMGMARLRMHELKRLGILRKGLTREDAPELWPEKHEIFTDEGLAEIRDLGREIIDTCVVDCRGVIVEDEEAGADPKARAKTLVEYFGLTDKLATKCMELQSLEHAQVFCSGS